MNKTKLIIGLLSLTFFFHSCKKVDDIQRSFEEVNLEQFKSNLIGNSIGNSDYKIVDVIITKSTDDSVDGLIVIENNNCHFNFIRDFNVSTNYIKGGEGYFILRGDISPETLESKVLNKYDNAGTFTIPDIGSSGDWFGFGFSDNNNLIFYNDNNQYEGTYKLTEIETLDDNDNKDLDFTLRSTLTNEDVEKFLNTESFRYSGKMKLEWKNDGDGKELTANFKTIDGGFLLTNGKIRNLSEGSVVAFQECRFMGDSISSRYQDQEMAPAAAAKE